MAYLPQTGRKTVLTHTHYRLAPRNRPSGRRNLHRRRAGATNPGKLARRPRSTGVQPAFVWIQSCATARPHLGKLARRPRSTGAQPAFAWIHRSCATARPHLGKLASPTPLNRRPACLRRLSGIGWRRIRRQRLRHRLGGHTQSPGDLAPRQPLDSWQMPNLGPIIHRDYFFSSSGVTHFSIGKTDATFSRHRQVTVKFGAQ